MKKLILFLLSITLYSSMMTIFPAASWALDEQQAIEGEISSYAAKKESSTSGYVYKLDNENDYQWRASKITYTEHYEDLQTLLDKADVVTVVEIKKLRPVKVSGVVFTDYDVDIKRVLKNSRNYDLADMEIRLIGGQTQTNQVNVPETPILEVGEIYLFAGNKTYSKNDTKKEFTPQGGYQGVFALETINGYTKEVQEYMIQPMNPHNAIEKSMIGNDISDIESLIADRKEESLKSSNLNETIQTDDYNKRMKINYVVPFNTVEEMLQDASLAVVAEVTDSYTDDSTNIVFTHYPVEVKKVIKNREKADLEGIDFVFTGGKTNRVESVVLETPKLEKGKQYLFITGNEKEEYKTHGIAGGYIGVFELTTENGGKEYTVVKMNPYNQAYEEELEGRTISEVEKMLVSVE